MKISSLYLLGSLWICAGACATGIIPVLELDFTTSATETLKKHGIHDACIIAAANPSAFTYCREGSPTLWKYQALDLDQQARNLNSTLLASISDARISIAEVDSLACEEDMAQPLIAPAIVRAIALGMIVLFVLMGLRYTYRATMDGYFNRTVYSGHPVQRPNRSLLANRSTTKALGAFTLAGAVAFLYLSYTTF